MHLLKRLLTLMALLMRARATPMDKSKGLALDEMTGSVKEVSRAWDRYWEHVWD